MTSEFESKGIKIYKDFLVAQWNDGTDCTEIKWVTFTSNDHPLRLECCVSTHDQMIVANPTISSLGFHYENFPMQYTEVFHSEKLKISLEKF